MDKATLMFEFLNMYRNIIIFFIVFLFSGYWFIRRSIYTKYLLDTIVILLSIVLLYIFISPHRINGLSMSCSVFSKSVFR